MAYQSSSNTVISDARSGSFANVTIQNAGSLVVDFAHTFQGTISGYVTGGAIDGVGNNYGAAIQKFPFATDTNARSVGNLTNDVSYGASHSSDTHGYTSGGYSGNSPNVSSPNPYTALNSIIKFPFAVDTNGTDVGSLTQTRYGPSGATSSTHGYASGGNFPPVGSVNTIDKFPFLADTNATDVGDLTVVRRYTSGQSSTTHGYASGGAAITNVIDKFPFSTDTNATDVGDLTQARIASAGQSSTTFGYASGGTVPPASPPGVNTIDKFPFASDNNATDVGDLTQGRYYPSGSSSTTHGYTSSGTNQAAGPAASLVNTMDKFPFATDTNATDVGDVAISVFSATGQQD